LPRRRRASAGDAVPQGPPSFGRRWLGHLAVRVTIVVALLALIRYGVVDFRPDPKEREASRQAALETAEQEARQRLVTAAQSRGCHLIARRVVGGVVHRNSVLDVAALLDHAQMLELTDGQVAELSVRRKECEAACDRAGQAIAAAEARPDTPERDQVVEQLRRKQLADHARRVLVALDLLDSEQRRKADEWLAAGDLQPLVSAGEAERSR